MSDARKPTFDVRVGGLDPRGIPYWTPPAVRCGICGEPFGSQPGDAQAEVVDTATGKHLVVHSEPCSYEHGDRYQLA